MAVVMPALVTRQHARKDSNTRWHRPQTLGRATDIEDTKTSCGSEPVVEQAVPVSESLLFEFDLAEEAVEASPQTGRKDAERLRHVVEQLRGYSRPSTDFQRQLLLDVQRFKRQCLREESRHDTIVLAAKLCGIGYRVIVREAVGGGPNCLSNLRHTFLYVAAEQETRTGAVERVIVEPHFREHFEIANACPGYMEILDAVPVEFVGSRECLFSLVSSLCHEIAHEFEIKGLMLPPWRQVKGMLSKWFPAQARDTECEASPPGPSSPDDSLALEPERPKPRKQPSDVWLPFQYDKY
mmetsp:Transcript_42536/g.76267  ORF Transcript_42536/g.76267 Transcript_42536/m.76267 type:complete len:296 (-) Transcript_42536:272-1159(-)